jgi:ATP synthase protein I
MADDGTDNNGKVAGDGKGALGQLVTAESMIQLAIALPAGCVIGWLIGAWMDRHFHQSWIAVAGILLGAVAGFVQIFRTASRFLKKSDRS